MKNYLNFEQDIKNLETELDKLKDPYNKEGLSEVDTDRISKIQTEIDDKLKEVYSNLNSWQITQVARFEERPKAKFYIENLFEDFIPLAGDRFYGEDKSVLTGFAKFNHTPVLVIGQEKGDDIESRIKHNFGSMMPEGFRKTTRLMRLADKFNIPIIVFIDTSGASPSPGAESRGQAEAIARSIECCMELKVPTISIVIGEGGSGGAIALASSNKVIMMENAIFSVISPEGCATILWRDPKKTLEAAEAMKLTSKELLNLGIIDEIIPEPIGGAHRDKDSCLNNVKLSIQKNLDEFNSMSRDEILLHRKNRFLSIGRKKGFVNKIDTEKDLTMPENLSKKIFLNFNKFKFQAMIIFGLLIILLIAYYL